jgi:hypothetical protein
LCSKAKEDIDIQQTLAHLSIHSVRTQKSKALSFAFIFDLLVANIKCCHVECLLYVAFTVVASFAMLIV